MNLAEGVEAHLWYF